MLLKKRKWVRVDNKFHVIQKLRKAIMKRSRLKKKAIITKTPIDISTFKKQCNYVVNLNQQAKFEYFSSYNSVDGNPLWAIVNSIFPINIARLILICFQ